MRSTTTDIATVIRDFLPARMTGDSVRKFARLWMSGEELQAVPHILLESLRGRRARRLGLRYHLQSEPAAHDFACTAAKDVAMPGTELSVMWGGFSDEPVMKIRARVHKLPFIKQHRTDDLT
jgi:hypothetical protein